MDIHLDDIRLHIEDRGAGRPVVLLHPWGLDSRAFDPHIGPLLEAGHRCITIDRRGHGRSELAMGGYDLDTLSRDVLGVLDHLDLSDVLLVGHSMGGTEAAHVVGGFRSPRVSQLVLSAAPLPCVEARPDRPDGIPRDMLVANREAMSCDLGGWIEANSEGYWGTADAGDWPLATEWTKRRLYETPLPVLLACNSTTVEADLRAELAAITIPTLVIHGDADRSAPLDFTGRQTAALLPNGSLHVIAGGGHGIYTSFAPAWIAAVLEFSRATRR